jgi:uncharacterized Ntn-hydrolase superfamily protein
VSDTPLVATFSIVGHDPATGDLGVAVQSRFFAVGAVVPWVRAGVGAIATQAGTNTSYGPRGLALLADGRDAPAVLGELLRDDPAVAVRQVGIVDAHGRAAAHTGPDCLEWAGHVTGPHFSAQGNILAGPQVVEAMARAFTAGGGDLADRLLAALQAGQAAGGDRRGMQSAALQVARADAGYNGWTDRYVDLRVDDHVDPIAELQRLLALQRAFHARLRPTAPVPLDGETLLLVQRALRSAGLLPEASGRPDAATRAALAHFAAQHGLEGPLPDDALPAPLFRALLARVTGSRPGT